MWNKKCDEICQEIHTKTNRKVLINQCMIWHRDIGQEVNYVGDIDSNNLDYETALKILKQKIIK